MLRRGRVPRGRLDRAGQDQPHGVRPVPGARGLVPGPERAHQPRAHRRVPRAGPLGGRRGARAHPRPAGARPRPRPRGDPRPQPGDARRAPRGVPHRRALRRRRLPGAARRAARARRSTRHCAPSRRAGARSTTRASLGIGIATVVDSTAWFARQETACVTVRPDGTVRVLAGTASAGQQHERAYATLVAEVLPVSVDDVEVIEGDTELVEGSAGTSGSRSLQLAGSAVRGAALDVLEQARQLAADLLEAAVDDIVVDDDQFIVRGVPARGFTLAALAARADGDRRRRPDARRPLRVRPGRRDLHAQRAPVGRRGRARHRAGHAAAATSRSPTAAGSSIRRRPRVRSSARARRASGRRCSRSSSTTTPATRSRAASRSTSCPAPASSRRSTPAS